MQGTVVESGPDLSREAQYAIRIVHAQQQRAESGSRAGCRCVADDHEFLALLALDLDPVRTAPSAVRRRQALADHALQAQLAGRCQQVARGLIEPFAQPYRIGQFALQRLAQ